MKTKKTILITVFLTLCVLAFSQVQLVYETNNHLKFGDIQITGNIDTFTEKLVKQGFTIRESNQYLAVLNAEMLGKPCTLNVNGTKKTRTVYLVSIMLPEGTDWQSIKEDYNKLKTFYTKNFGVGISKEYFLAPYIDGDGKEMDALSEEKLNYETYWKSESGIIMVSIMNTKEVYVAYQDKTNKIIAENEELE